MVQREACKIDYLSRVFSGLSIEKKDTILDIARSLLHIQEHDLGSKKEDRSLLAENTPSSLLEEKRHTTIGG